MMTFINDLKYKFKVLDVFGKLIVINIVVFILGFLIDRVLKLHVFQYFALPSNFNDILFQPWALMSYGFLHGSLWHLLFNMLMLYYLTRVIGNLLPHKTVLNIYFLGVISGGVLYLLVANLWPTNFFGITGVLIGASAGVAALLAYVGTYLPNSEISLFGAFNVKWLHIFLFFVGIDVIRLLLGLNQGGYVSHIGGYILGFYYAKQLQSGTDIGKGFERLMDHFMGMFSSKSNLKTVHKKPKMRSKFSKQTPTNSATKQQRIDAILDKISKSGYESLSAEDKQFLFKAGKD